MPIWSPRSTPDWSQLLVDPRREPGVHGAVGPKFAEKLGKVALAVYHGLYVDETAYLCHWNIPDTHPLEMLGRRPRLRRHGDVDAAAHRAALRRSVGRMRSWRAFTAQSDRRTLEIVKDYWTRALGGGSGWTTSAMRQARRTPTPMRSGSTRSTTGSCAAPRLPTEVRRRRSSPDRSAVTSRCGSLDRATSRRCGSRAANSCARGAIVVGRAAGTLGARRNRAAPRVSPSIQRRDAPATPAVSRSSSGPTRRSGTAASRTSAGCRSCQSR